MRNIIGKSVLWGMCGMLLASCQTFQHARETANIRYSAPKLGSTVATVYCEGTANCEFERINNIVIVDESTHLINPSAIGQGYVRLKQRSTFDSNAIFLTLPAQQHEVVIRFYPISPDRAEKINVYKILNRINTISLSCIEIVLNALIIYLVFLYQTRCV